MVQKNVLTTSGIIFLSFLSKGAANATAKIIGITVDVYPLDGIIIGIPKKLSENPISKGDPLNTCPNALASFIATIDGYVNAIPSDIPINSFNLNFLATV
jgi:hypothetical protein